MKMLNDVLKGSDNVHKVSAMRVSVLMIVSTILGIYVAHNIMAMIAGKTLVSLGWDQVVVLTTILGAKALQHKSEASSTKSSVTFSSSVSNGGSKTISEDKDLSNPN